MLNVRVGLGYDVHRLVEGRPLVLGGVRIDHERGLDGHSDADALTHAIVDALLGAAALGDIGQHFPDTDERWRGAESIALLERTVALLDERGFEVVTSARALARFVPSSLASARRSRSVNAGATRRGSIASTRRAISARSAVSR